MSTAPSRRPWSTVSHPEFPDPVPVEDCQRGARVGVRAPAGASALGIRSLSGHMAVIETGGSR